MPQKVLRVYELRSTVVHGSDIGVASKTEYNLMLQFAQNTFKHFIEFVNNDKKGLTKPFRIYKRLLESDHASPFVTWLDECFSDDYSKNISNSMKEDLNNLKTRQ